MIDIKQAVKSSIEFINSVYDPSTLKNLQLEEVELSDDERYWYVTMGFSREVEPFDITQAALGHFRNYERVYKVIKVDADTAKALSMKIRQL